MSANVANPWKWTPKRRKAARFLAQGKWTIAEVAAKVGIEQRMIYRWKNTPEFAARVQRLAERYASIGDEVAYANQKRRVEELHALAVGLVQVRQERAADPAMAAVPGGTSGLLVETVKVIGAGPAAREVKEYRVDVGLVKETREVFQDIAEETGQRVRKIANTTPDGQSEALGMNPAERASRILAILVQAGGPLPAPPQTITVQALPAPTPTP